MTNEPVKKADTDGAGPQHVLLASIRTLRPSLSPAQLQVVDTITRHVEMCPRLTVSEFAERTGTSPTTVVRTAHLLGYSGYRALQRAMVEVTTLASATRESASRWTTP
ncbi:MurR/RpiR family transcriptional regulator [Streptomyces sp. NPDC058579]|uniref:MurR/RpiR family transcriptional regulator n=1 Tax=Streptomyces sp. NPDC058579 TaxID=3346548 RepID=UPI00365CB6E2